jgi:hypothetical protein
VLFWPIAVAAGLLWLFRHTECAYYGDSAMARWPRHVWTSIFTYSAVFVLFPLLCLLAYAWVRGWIF